MRFARLFVDRPILAAVLSILIFLAGAISIWKMPVSEYPEVVPPAVVVRAVYPGANPKVIAESVALPLEEAINGVDDMLYMASQATLDGVMTLTVTFRLGTDPDRAQQLVQNRVAQAQPRLPEEVRRLGVTTTKSSSDLTLVVHLTSPDERYDMTYLRNYAALHVKDRLARIDGVGQVETWGAGDYAMRIWLDPDKVAARGLTASDVVHAIREQNANAAGGVVGGAPARAGTDLELAIHAKGRLATEQEFAEIVIRQTAGGAVTRLADVARIELGASQYSLRSLLDNKPAVAIGIFQAPGSNAIAVANEVHRLMEELRADMPAGVSHAIVYDTTRFVRASIESVVKTLLEALALVVLVVIVFLQSWRASIIPLLAVPVSIVGTFALMLAFGFSINALSLFGLVLAIGIVVDDAIVVVENVERNIAAGLSPRDASYQAMREVSGPIVAIALVLVAVFVPMAFVPGLTGEFYRQFALTISISTVISAFNSLTLSPALAALLLRGHDAPKDRLSRIIDTLFGWFFRRFNRGFARAGAVYGTTVGFVLGRKLVIVALYGALAALTWAGFQTVPKGFIPAQDKQYLVAMAQLPDGASLDRTESVVRAMSTIAMAQPGVESAVAFPGLSINGFTNSSNAAVVFITLDPFDKRGKPALSGDAIAQALNGEMMAIEEAFVAVFPPPPVLGLGTIGGFKLQLEDRGALGYEALYEARQAFLNKAWATPELAGVFSSYQINVPQLFADVDRVKARQLGVPVSDVFETMQIYLGSLYVNDFNRFGRTYQVKVQADAPFRSDAEDVLRLRTRNSRGEMVPLAALLRVEPSFGPDRVTRYNNHTSADINGGPAPGVSSGQARAAVERIAAETLPKGVAWEWTELTYQEQLAGDSGWLVFPLAVLLVFLVLAALYESWTLPLAVILIVPMALLSAITGVWLAGGDNNIFTQISLVVLVGLAAKNSILIVEFALELERRGRSIAQAAIEASRLRLRPILMTSFAFIMGVVPLVLASGAGAEMRRAIGIAVFSGMLGVTLFGLLLTPLFYVLLRTLAQRLQRGPAVPLLPDPQPAGQPEPQR
ncbi:efflux RND transporter permease subunit [Piscinibacter sakaiensis]|uniref:efflux RND transporter permease subunit n=1 Tax=Piscinibacter sakaiensis TaxID=1547922 RepID=UPI003AAD7809